jgi:hypothetical protein
LALFLWQLAYLSSAQCIQSWESILVALAVAMAVVLSNLLPTAKKQITNKDLR